MDWIGTYQATTALTLAAFAVFGAVVVRDRVPGAVALYTLWCGMAAFVSFMAASAPEFSKIFYGPGVKSVAAVFVVFVGCEALRMGSGRMGRDEAIAAAGLTAAFLAMAAAGELMRSPRLDLARMWAQSLAVVLPVLVAAALLTAGPIERRETVAGPLVRLPAPRAAMARVRR